MYWNDGDTVLWMVVPLYMIPSREAGCMHACIHHARPDGVACIIDHACSSLSTLLMIIMRVQEKASIICLAQHSLQTFIYICSMMRTSSIRTTQFHMDAYFNFSLGSAGSQSGIIYIHIHGFFSIQFVNSRERARALYIVV
jgi:hypothetical protein